MSLFLGHRYYSAVKWSSKNGLDFDDRYVLINEKRRKLNSYCGFLRLGHTLLVGLEDQPLEDQPLGDHLPTPHMAKHQGCLECIGAPMPRLYLMILIDILSKKQIW